MTVFTALHDNSCCSSWYFSVRMTTHEDSMAKNARLHSSETVLRRPLRPQLCQLCHYISYHPFSSVLTVFTRHLQVCAALYQSMIINYMVRKSKVKGNPRLPSCWTPPTLLLLWGWPPLHVCLEFDIWKGLQQAMEYERWRTGELEARFF